MEIQLRDIIIHLRFLFEMWLDKIWTHVIAYAVAGEGHIV